MCDHCQKRKAIKTGGNGDWECENYAMYGDCEGQKPTVREEKVGRNELCPCGSGKKNKKCCNIKPKHSKGK